MLFNSYIFLFCFLPVAILGYYLLAHFAGPKAAKIWLAIASLVFYGWWKVGFIQILLTSIAFNYALSLLILGTEQKPARQRVLLTVGIVANISLLVYYKYLFVMLDFFHAHGWLSPDFVQVLLPLGISFFTFTQIGFLVDCQQGVVQERNLLNYVLFVTFFPHLIAGPILHHREIMPQFADDATYRLNARLVATGLTLFAFGLVKKVVLADSMAPWVDAGFSHPGELGILSAWSTAVGFVFQIYFDFSGYSDMAIGLGAMFGVRLPLNFNSPYKSMSIIDFWQRWHMTLTRYLTLLIFNPIFLRVIRRRMAQGLVASHKASESLGGFLSLVAFPTGAAMFIAGIWHGAGMQYVVFGSLHAAYLIINHAWRIFGPKLPAGQVSISHRVLGHLWRTTLTFLSVVLADVFFRASSVGDAVKILGGAFGSRGSDLPLSVGVFRLMEHQPLRNFLYRHGLIVFSPTRQLWETVTVPLLRNTALIIGLAMIAWGTPNSVQILGEWSPALQEIRRTDWKCVEWRPNLAWATGMAALLAYVLTQLDQSGRFLYFQF